ncbi:serine O-acetyltransferase [Thiomonas bhubaneswarensis]|uniref:Serine acetyltransferase n=1 Tax=Thiomonas bhubaneswarensis TaxID=339866 RepID=A0A0K6IAE3_9BURK|nr:serine acetyltransferase [Thiomonas bhubaneswarensis]CUB00095.1 Serine acetyltransferase [Thiomonas bhubaneswarensis]
MRSRDDPDWQADLRRVNQPRPLFKEQSLWAIWVYRYGRRVDARSAGLRKRLHTRLYWLLFRWAETVTGISLPKAAQIGGGLRIYHFGGVFIHPEARIGSHCTLRQGVTIGNKTEGGPVPVLEDGVELGAYAQVIGGVRLGAGCRVGALSVVTRDVPPGVTVAGAPARPLHDPSVGTVPSP